MDARERLVQDSKKWKDATRLHISQAAMLLQLTQRETIDLLRCDIDWQKIDYSRDAASEPYVAWSVVRGEMNLQK